MVEIARERKQQLIAEIKGKRFHGMPREKKK